MTWNFTKDNVLNCILFFDLLKFNILEKIYDVFLVTCIQWTSINIIHIHWLDCGLVFFSFNDNCISHCASNRSKPRTEVSVNQLSFFLNEWFNYFFRWLFTPRINNAHYYLIQIVANSCTNISIDIYKTAIGYSKFTLKCPTTHNSYCSVCQRKYCTFHIYLFCSWVQSVSF